MVKGAYLTTIDLQNQSSGIAKKICSQIMCFNKNFGDSITIDKTKCPKWIFEGFTGRLLSALGLAGFLGLNSLLKWIIDNVDVSELEYIYMRKNVFSRRTIKYLMHLKNINAHLKIVVEIPTYPYDSEYKKFRRLIALPIDKAARKKAKSYIDRIATYSNDNQIFGIKTIQISNGIDYNNTSIAHSSVHEGIHIIAVALFEKWHGYDRFIQGMIEDINTVKEFNITLHLVGKGKILNQYQKMVIDNGIEDYVIFHGELAGKDLDNVYDQCDIALDAMGRHRVGIYYNSTLKGKEYCAKGMPIISGVETELDHVSDFPYYLRVGADDSAISMKSVVNFYNKIYTNVSGNNIRKIIREKTQNLFDYKNTFSPVIEYIKS